MEKVSDATFDQEVTSAEGLIVVDFGADWCSPCKKLDPIMEELAGEYKGRVKVRKLDVSESPQVAQRFRVLSVPQVLFFQDGRVVEQVTGVMPKGQLVEKFDLHLQGE